jgi:hypothetical protein
MRNLSAGVRWIAWVSARVKVGARLDRLSSFKKKSLLPITEHQRRLLCSTGIKEGNVVLVRHVLLQAACLALG